MTSPLDPRSGVPGEGGAKTVTQPGPFVDVDPPSVVQESGRPAVPPRRAKAEKGPPMNKPTPPGAPPRPAKRIPLAPSNLGASADEPTVDPKDPEVALAKPPLSSASERTAPLPPERPKPQVPARPSKATVEKDSEDAPLAMTVSAASKASTGREVDESASSKDVAMPPAPRPKPAIPARPHGGKIASLKAGFMSDLDKRLQLGPRTAKVPEKAAEQAEADEDKERAPLGDARRDRARGPSRRKPGTSPSSVPPTSAPEPVTSQWGRSPPLMIWQITAGGQLDVADHGPDVDAPASKAMDDVPHDTSVTALPPRPETRSVTDAATMEGISSAPARSAEREASFKSHGSTNQASNDTDVPVSSSSASGIAAPSDQVAVASQEPSTTRPSPHEEIHETAATPVEVNPDTLVE